MPRRLPRPAASLFVLGLLMASSPLSAALPDQPLHRLKALQQQILMREPAERIEKRERFREWRKRAARNRNAGKAGMRRRSEVAGDAVRPRRLDLFARARPMALSAITAPPNRLMNDTLGEPDGSCQSEVSIASWGNYVVAAWNDGIGIYNGTDTQGFAYSTDAGLTWVDGDAPPPANVGQWSSDPVVAVNEKTGAFYYAGLCDQALAGTNGIGVVRGTFNGNNFSWGTPTLAVAFDNGSALLDKEWLAADSLTGNLYLTYSHFSIIGGQFVSDDIRFLRSTNDNQTWSSPVKISAGIDDGFVQGSRPAVGPSGEIYAVWHAIGQPGINSAFGRDFLRVRRSVDQGVSFQPQVTADSLFTNFPSGAPGFNRGIGITFPSITVDRSNSANRGRVYLTWNEALNFYADVNSLPDERFDPSTLETENNNGPLVADNFSPGDILRGVVSVTGNPGDLDYWKWNATQGSTYFFWLDSLGTTLDPSFRIFCTDGISNLAFNNNDAGQPTLLVFTAPTTATYYLRVASYSGTHTGVYRVRTTSHQPRGDDRARDHRDIFVKSSINGAVWGPTVRVNDDPGYFDDFLPEVVADGTGRVFVADYDWRDATNCGGGSNVYLYRSDDAGQSWIPGTRMSDFTTDWWNGTYSTLVPNQGDYIGLFARDSTVFVAWGDGRNLDPNNADPDAYVTSTTLSCTSAPIVGLGIAVTADHDSATVTWGAPNGTAATLFRRAGTGSYVNLGGVVADASDQIVYIDAAVTEGVTYSYRLGVTGFCQQFAAEQSVTIPTPSGPQLAIYDVRPNPTPDDINVTFTLASSAPATLALYDISGREIRRLDVTSSGPGGPHLVKLYSGPRLRSGIYFVQLSQGGSTKEKRVSVFP